MLEVEDKVDVVEIRFLLQVSDELRQLKLLHEVEVLLQAEQLELFFVVLLLRAQLFRLFG